VLVGTGGLVGLAVGGGGAVGAHAVTSKANASVASAT
jgi:hypothetical protein